jgi:hypothetical protein
MSRNQIIALVKETTRMVVQTGPFSGLRLNDLQTWGGGDDVGPQLLGIYEQELHSALLNFVSQRPTTVINIGCAEGYYAVGLARLLTGARVFAFDIDSRAQHACRANAELNGVGDRLVIDGSCSFSQLCKIITQDPNALLIVDCEGYEKALFADHNTPAVLKSANIIIETHGFVDRSILPTLISQFSGSHRISIVHSGARNPNAFSFLDKCSDLDKWLLVCENRPELQSWLVCERRSLPNVQDSARSGTATLSPSTEASRALPTASTERQEIQPLIYTVCFGSQEYFECLYLMLRSLYSFGKYDGEFLVLTDRTDHQFGHEIPAEYRDKVRAVKVDLPNMMTRYTVCEHVELDNRPLLYVDTDTVITQSVQPALRQIGSREAIYVCSEGNLHRDINGIPASALNNNWANWFGLDLFKADSELRDRPLPCLNSGLFGFSSPSVFADVSSQMQRLYVHEKWSVLAKHFTDQPLFNYAVAKSKVVDTATLSGAVAFVRWARGSAEFSRPFTHFLWARGSEKLQQMAEFLEILKARPEKDLSHEVSRRPTNEARRKETAGVQFPGDKFNA